MRYLPLLIIILTLSGCKTEKSVVSEHSVTSDSVGASALHRTVAVIDTSAFSKCFEFDTLTIETTSSGVMRLRAVKGRLTKEGRRLKALTAESDLRESAGLKRRSVTSSSELSSTASLLEPPSGMGVVILTLAALAIAGVILYIYLRF